MGIRSTFPAQCILQTLKKLQQHWNFHLHAVQYYFHCSHISHIMTHNTQTANQIKHSYINNYNCENQHNIREKIIALVIFSRRVVDNYAETYVCTCKLWLLTFHDFSTPGENYLYNFLRHYRNNQLIWVFCVCVRCYFMNVFSHILLLERLYTLKMRFMAVWRPVLKHRRVCLLHICSVSMTNIDNISYLFITKTNMRIKTEFVVLWVHK